MKGDRTYIEGRLCEETQREVGHLQATEGGLEHHSLTAARSNQPYQHLDLGLQASETVKQ